MHAYVLAEIEVTDAEGYKGYTLRRAHSTGRLLLLEGFDG